MNPKFYNFFVLSMRNLLPAVSSSVLAVSLTFALPVAAQAHTTSFDGAIQARGNGFFNPVGVATDKAGNIFVADYDNNAVKEIVAAGGYTTIQTLGYGFSGPWGVAVDASDNVFVTDSQNNEVKEIVAAGGYTTIHTLGSGFYSPSGIGVDKKGNVFVADFGNNAVKEILAVDGYTQIVTLASGFFEPSGLTVDGVGNVFVADEGNNLVKEILVAGGYTTVNTLGGGFLYPFGIAVDRAGNVYVSDSGSNKVKKILVSSGYQTVKTLDTGFNESWGLAVSQAGHLYVADGYVVQEISLSGGNFGNVQVGTNAHPVAMTFTFDFAGTLGSTVVLTEGQPNQDFWDTGYGTCAAGSYSAGETCIVMVNFTPSLAQARKGTVSLYDGGGKRLATGSLKGTGIPHN